MSQDLDRNLINALEELRREFDDKLSRQRAEIEKLMAPEDQPAEIRSAETAEPVAPTASGVEPLEELKLAASEIDRAESQADVLDGLIRGATRFSSRAAVFLCRDGGLHGWGAIGFGPRDSSTKNMTLETPEGSSWQQIEAGEGGICLSAADCAVLSDQLDAPAADIGILVPFVLRRQVAAVLYADRVSGDPTFNISALQLLSFLAGQTVETLPIRERASTSSLQLAVAGFEAGAPATTEEVDKVVAEADAAPVTEEIVDDVEEPADVEPQTELEPPAQIPEEEEPPPSADDLLAESLPEELPDLEQPAFIAPDLPTVEMPPVEDRAVESAPPEAEIPETGLPELEVPVAPEPVAETPQTAPEPEPAPAPEPAAGADKAPSPMSTQVQPPQDVDGPGWAFTTTRIPTAAGAEAQHEEARRLARLLVTEIKLYNEELVEEGRQQGNVYGRLQEDIERSRQIFDDRIDPEIRTEKDYFLEALVRILAGGDPKALGISE